MPAPKFSEVRQFFGVAQQRLEDAYVLLAGQRTTGAVYLAGYAVECALKALLLAHAPASQHGAIVKTFRGNSGHNYDWLQKGLRRRQVSIPPLVHRQLILVSGWSTTLRYMKATKTLREAKAFLNATATVADWVKGRL